jgi:hypothetical protein
MVQGEKRWRLGRRVRRGSTWSALDLARLARAHWQEQIFTFVVQVYCTRKCTSRVQYNGVQVRGRTHMELCS